MKTVLIGLLGTTLDAARAGQRWERWRPSVDLCRHEDLVFDRYELLHPVSHTRLAHQVATDVASVSPETEVRLHKMSVEDPWDLEEVFSFLYDFALGYPFDEERERYLVNITTGTHVAQICLFLLNEARHLPGKLIQCSPPTGKGRGQPGTYRILDLNLSRYDQVAARFSARAEEGAAFLKGGIATRDGAFNRLIAEIEKVAVASEAPMLLLGPTGAGKTRLARRVFELKQARRQLKGRLVELNCATLRGDAALSALFGHRKGAFTGAVRDRAGALKEADGGLLFLDEIAELGLDEQAMLLRALESGLFLPLGADRDAQSRFQLLAGTNADLYARAREGSFREDLLARIDLWTFQLPSLAERRADLEPNLDFELARVSDLLGHQVSFNQEARAAWLSFAHGPRAAWSRNFRDLRASVERMATLAAGARIDERLVASEVMRLTSRWHQGGPSAEPPLEATEVLGERWETLDRFDQVQLAEVIRVCRRSKSLAEAGRALFAQSRKERARPNDTDRLRKYLARFDLTFAEL
jgi:transcriptional regulatory protein RtcR